MMEPLDPDIGGLSNKQLLPDDPTITLIINNRKDNPEWNLLLFSLEYLTLSWQQYSQRGKLQELQQSIHNLLQSTDGPNKILIALHLDDPYPGAFIQWAIRSLFSLDKSDDVEKLFEYCVYGRGFLGIAKLIYGADSFMNALHTMLKEKYSYEKEEDRIKLAEYITINPNLISIIADAFDTTSEAVKTAYNEIMGREKLQQITQGLLQFSL